MKTHKGLNQNLHQKFEGDAELMEGLNMIVENEGKTFAQIEQFFAKAAEDFESKLNYELARQAVIIDAYRYANIASIVALLIVFMMIPLVNMASVTEPVSFEYVYGRTFSPY